MPLDPRAKRLLDMLALSGVRIENAAQRRDSFAKLMAMAERPGPAMAVADIALAGRHARVYRAVEGNCPALLFLHGGGLVAGSLETHDSLCGRLAAAGGFAVISLDYRLAPEHRFPAALQDADAALRALAPVSEALKIDPQRLAIGGDSAGALLAALVSVQTAVPLKAQLLLCPVVDLAFTGGSRAALAPGFLIDAEIIARDVADCLGAGSVAADFPSPLRLPTLKGCPPSIIDVAEFDPLRDEGLALAERLQQHGCAVDLVQHEGMVHGFHSLTAFLPQGLAATEAAARRLAAHLA